MDNHLKLYWKCTLDVHDVHLSSVAHCASCKQMKFFGVISFKFQISAPTETSGRKITSQIWNYVFIYNRAALTNQAYILYNISLHLSMLYRNFMVYCLPLDTLKRHLKVFCVHLNHYLDCTVMS